MTGAGAGGIRAGQAYVELVADDRALQAGLAAAQRRLAAWGGQIRHIGLSVAGAGAGLLAPLIASAKLFASSGDALSKLAVRTGLSVELLSQLKFAAGLTGASLEELERASRRLSVTIVSAMKGSQGAMATLGGPALVRRLAPLTQDERFLAVAKAIGLITDPARRAAAAVAVFGRSGTELLPLIAQLDALRAEALRTGVVMSREQAERAHRLQEAWERLEGAMSRLTKGLSSVLAPAMTRWAEAVVPVLIATKQWIAQHQELVVRIAEVGAVLVVTGSSVVAFGATVTGVAWACRGLRSAVTGVIAVLTALRTAVTLGIAAVAALRAQALGIGLALRTVAAIGGSLSTGLAVGRAGVLALALAFGRLQVTALGALRGLPGVLARLGGGAVAATSAVAGAAARGVRRLPERGRTDLGAGAAIAAEMSGRVMAPLRSGFLTLIGLPTRLGAAFGALAVRGLAALGALRAALGGLQRTGAAAGSALLRGGAAALQALPALASRTLATVPLILSRSWSAVAGVSAVGAQVLGRSLVAIPGVALASGRAVIAGLSSVVAAVPTVLAGTVGLVTTVVRSSPALRTGGFGLLRGALVALPALFTAAFAVVPALIAIALDPVVLLTAAIIGLGGYLVWASGSGQTALAQLGQAFAEVKDDAVTAFAGISDALAAGDIRGAAQILWAFLRLEWTRGLSWIQNLTQSFAAGVAKIFYNVGFGIDTAIWTAVNGIADAIDSVISAILSKFTTVVGTIAAKVATLLEAIGVVDAGTSDQLQNLSTSMAAGVDQAKTQRAAERDQQLTDFKALWDEKIADINDWQVAGMQSRDAEVAARRADLDQAVAAAAKTRHDQLGAEAPGKGKEPGAPESPTIVGEPPDLGQLAADLAKGLNTTQQRVDTVGLFNPAAFGQLGIGGNAAQRGAEAQEKTARFTERIMNVVENGGELTFE